ncbi:hypothetical protein LWM68_19510 [Niabella sp. W65]|nr:hypothetical protein [Niabella sp. W65]MCH7364755.1 hypothetical protein [Niabella sp. W65]
MQFSLYRHQESRPNSLQYDDVNRFVEDRNGNIWIGTNGVVLFISTGRTIGSRSTCTSRPTTTASAPM